MTDVAGDDPSADSSNRDRFSFLRGDVPASFERRLIALATGQELAYDAAEWQDALVVVERGALELESLSGCRCVFASGSVLWLAGLPLRALRSRGTEPTVLVAVSRR